MNPDLQLMPFQDAGSTLLANSLRAMLVWDPGVGKTPTGVRACVKTSARRILVFCPPIGVSVWRQHFEDWSHYHSRVLDSTTALKPYAFAEGTGVRIVPYSRARPDTTIFRALNDQDWDVVLIDEAHYLKTASAQRTRAVYGAKTDLRRTPLERAKHIWCLTGTPLLNHPAEFWTHLHALKPDTIILPQLGVMSQDVFTARFCVVRQTPYGVHVLGGRNTSELAERIKPFIDRKRTKDVLHDLPDLRVVEHPLPADTFIDRTLRDELAEAMTEFGIADENLDNLDDDQLLDMVQAGGVAWSTIRRLTGRAKVEGVTTLVHDFMDDNEESKLIVFAHHREVIRDLAQNLKDYTPLVITGATSLKDREANIILFQTNPKFRLIILAIDAAGEVITLHAAHNVFVVEPSTVPARNAQAIARAHRKGQKHPVLARFVLLPGTLDARVMSIVARKTRDIAKVVDGVNLPATPAPAVADAFPDTF